MIMNAIAKDEAFQTPSLSLDECLAQMERYGNPRVGKFSNGWHANVEVFVTGQGAEFKVASEFNHDTPTAAANECYARLRDSLKKLGVRQ